MGVQVGARSRPVSIFNPAATALRHGGADGLTQALRDSRRDTLATFALYEAALAASDLAVPYHPQINPPRWELGHIGWFQDWWLGRNPQHLRGLDANPDTPRLPAARPGADALYNSSLVPHATRWHLPLPSAQATREDLAQGLERNLQLLADRVSDDHGIDNALYFHRLCLAHEDMHHEAALYSAQALGIAVGDARWQPAPLPDPGPPLDLPAGPFHSGVAVGDGFAFDNEQGAHDLVLPACRMDSQVLRWAEYLPFVEAGGYRDTCWWPGRAGAWRAAQDSAAPRYLRRAGAHWEQWRHGQWLPLDQALPVCHLTAFEAQAWCAWAGRRLPGEAEWERAALSGAPGFHWGAVWEWTASAFAPYPGFTPHPYRDYSSPWFDGRPVLRGASFGTQPRMRHPRYRNFFTPERNDIFAGFRSCAVTG